MNIIGQIFGIAVFIIVFLILTFLVLEIRNAPEGWEDENGFHKGKEPVAKLKKDQDSK